ncbi:hypothetical protein [Arenicella sp. 4NH20-0111]|uniref:hypothetical protein n=1 Tax=Arenicella sp. 4NH20-0111 TaxID=3127648 RepID=UPI00333EDA02
MNTLLFGVAYIALFTLPGVALCHLGRRHKFESSPLAFISLSYLVFTLIFILANSLSFESNTLIIGLVIGSLGSTFYLFRQSAFSTQSDWVVPTLTVIGASLLYHAIFGSYAEVPADVYAHLERIQAAQNEVSNNSLGPALPWTKLLRQGSGVYYFYAAIIAEPFHLSGMALFEALDFLNRTLFLLGVFFFSRLLFSRSPHANKASYLAVLFVTLHMGINVFSFVRYYSLAPSILALPLYFYAISLFIEIVSKPMQQASVAIRLFLILLLVIACAAIHVQEAMFIVTIIATMAIVILSSLLLPIERPSPSTLLLCGVIMLIALISFISIYLYSASNLTRAPNAHWRLWEFGEGFWFFPQLTILNLKYQFIRVTTIWGLLVYVLFFLNIRRYKKNYFILAGMLSPIFTFLNPFFVDLFLRHYNSTTIWRTCYLIPLHFVAADLFLHYLKQLQGSPKISTKIASGSILLSLAILLTPIANTWKASHYSRFPTLFHNERVVSYKHYSDLLKALDSLPDKRNVLTDPMTGYMISGLTKHHSSRKKFYRNNSYKHFSFKHYNDNPLDQHSGMLLIVNLRAKVKSGVGELANHWSKNEWLNTKNYYPNQLLVHLESRPNTFSKIWSKDEITIYEIL